MYIYDLIYEKGLLLKHLQNSFVFIQLLYIYISVVKVLNLYLVTVIVIVQNLFQF